MLTAEEMKAKAEQCDDMADKAHDRGVAHTFRELACHWRDMAYQLKRLEHNDAYRAAHRQTAYRQSKERRR